MRVNFELLSGGRRGQVVQLEAERITIGRDPASMLAFDPQVDRAVSSHHAEVTRGADGHLEISDLGSRNGTYVDGEPVTGTRTIAPGATIQFGSTGPMARVVYRVEAPPPALPDPAQAPYAHPPTPTADVPAIAPGSPLYDLGPHPAIPAIPQPAPISVPTGGTTSTHGYAPPPPLEAVLSTPPVRPATPPGAIAAPLPPSYAAPSPLPFDAPSPPPPALERSTPVSTTPPPALAARALPPFVLLEKPAKGLSTLSWALLGTSAAVTAVSIGVILAAVTGGSGPAPLPVVIAKSEALPRDPALPSAATGAGPALLAAGAPGAPRAAPRPAAPSQGERTASLVAAQQDLLRRALGAASHAPAEAREADPARAPAAGGPAPRADFRAAAEEERRRLDEATAALVARGAEDVVALEARRREALESQRARLVDAEKRMRESEARRAPDLGLRRQEAATARAERAALDRAQESLDRRLPSLAYVVAESSILPAGAEAAVPLARAEGNGYFVAAGGLLRTTKRIAEPWKFDLRGLGVAKRILSLGPAVLSTRYAVYVTAAQGGVVALDPPGGVALVAADPDELEDEFREVDIGARFGGTGREYVRPHLGAAQGGHGSALLSLRGASGLRALATSSAPAAPEALLLALGLVRAAPEAGSGAALRLLPAWAPGTAGAEPGATEEDALRSGLPPGLEGAPLLLAAAPEELAVAVLGGAAGRTGLSVIPAAAPPAASPAAPRPLPCASRGHALSPASAPENCPLCPLPPPQRMDVPVEVADEARGSYAIIEARVERRLRGTGYQELRAVVVLEAIGALGDAPFPGAVVVHELAREGGLDWDELSSADVTLLAVGRERVHRWPAPDDDRLRSLVAPGVKITVAIADAHDRDGGFPVRRFVIAPAKEVAQVAARLRSKGLSR